MAVKSWNRRVKDRGCCVLRKCNVMKKQRVLSILLFVLLQVVTILGLRMFMNQEQNNVLSERQEHLQRQYKASSLTYQRLARLAFEQHFNQADILTLMSKAEAAGSAERGELRQRLYTKIQLEYNYLRKAGFHQVHFHFNDGTSFLRLHSPKMFGDQLQSVRPSIARMIQEKKALQGYEIGRHWQAYRFLFPLWLDDRFLGSVEISLRFSALLINLMDSFPSQARLVFSRQVAAEHLDPGPLQRHYQVSALGPAFLEEPLEKQSTPLNLNDKNAPIDAQTLNRISRGVGQYANNIREAVSVAQRVGGEAILTTLLPIKNISGQQSAILIFYEKFHYISILRHRYVVGWLIVTAFSFLLLIFHNRYSRKLQESHAELDQIFNTAADGIRVMDKKGIIIRANNTFSQLVVCP